MNILKIHFIQTAKIIITGLVIGLGVNFLFAYTGPISSPPDCISGNPGCDAPINVGPLSQLKSGPLSLVSLFVNSLTIPTGSPSAGKVLTAVDGTGLASWQELAPRETGVVLALADIGFGAWETKTSQTIYQATTDGFATSVAGTVGVVGVVVLGATDEGPAPTIPPPPPLEELLVLAAALQVVASGVTVTVTPLPLWTTSVELLLPHVKVEL